MAQVPRGPEDKNCPTWLSAMSEVCHKCPLWVKMQMADPHDPKQTVDEWNCSHAWQPLLLAAINNQIVGQMLALQREVHEMRTEAKKASDENVALGSIAIRSTTAAICDALGASQAVNNKVMRLPSQ